MDLLQVRTGCRLHFGLMELAEGQPLRFAGLGMMLKHPQLLLEFVANQHAAGDAGLSCQCPSEMPDSPAVEQRIDDVLRRRTERPVGGTDAGCQVRVVDCLPLHHGLGAGTQLAAATAVGLELWHRQTATPAPAHADNGWQLLSETAADITPAWLVQHAGRGLRSAIGLHGFVQGGLILDEGYAPLPAEAHTSRSIAARSIAPPAHWQVILICPRSTNAVHGLQEAELLAASGEHPNAARDQMYAVAQQIMQAAGEQADFELFTRCLEEYMQLAGLVFARQQGGLYNGSEVERAATLAQQCGLRGVGQSSWGPTVFGFTADSDQAESCARWLQQQHPSWTITTTQPAGSGAAWRWL